MRALNWRCVAIFLLLFGAQAGADTVTGKVVAIMDGDTLEVLVNQTPVRVRLAGIDAPEKAQPFGAKAKQYLASLVGGREVQVESNKTDRYGRTVGKVIAQGQDVNLALVSAGLAWWYRAYAQEQTAVDRARYEAAETQAKGARRGLWADQNPLAPWDWRHRPASTPTGCPCGSGLTCTGPRGGVFCVTEQGTKQYQDRSDRSSGR